MLALSPAFNGGVHEYTAETSNATNTITATAAYALSDILIEVNDEEIANGTAATWEDGANEVTITVTNGPAETVYTVTVTKS